jgi:hypothetical protein
MKTNLYYLVIIAWALFCCSCECQEDNLQCGVLSERSRDWLAFRDNDVLIYSNAAGAQYRFTMKTVNTSPPYVSYATTAGWFGGCNQEPCRAYADVEGYDSTANDMLLRYTLTQGGEKNELREISYYLGNFSYKINLPYTNLELEEPYITVTTIPEITLGSHTYEKVQVAALKSSSGKIKKVYVAEYFGIVGFEDKEATLFYLN